jgi:L-threonylcarbamoyladenylate synthase
MVVRLEEADASASLLRVLRNGGVAVIPCDTIYGLVGVAPGTETRISRIKQRDPSKPLLRLIESESWLGRYSTMALPPALRPFWPGPLTIVFPAIGGGTVALRVPADAWLRGVLVSLDRPLVSTSVNIEGDPPLGRIADIVSRFEAQVDIVVDDGDRIDASPSTLVDATSAPYRVLRQGALRLPEDLTGTA